MIILKIYYPGEIIPRQLFVLDNKDDVVHTEEYIEVTVKSGDQIFGVFKIAEYSHYSWQEFKNEEEINLTRSKIEAL